MESETFYSAALLALGPPYSPRASGELVADHHDCFKLMVRNMFGDEPVPLTYTRWFDWYIRQL